MQEKQATLKQRLDDFQAKPFPMDSANDYLSHLHAELAEFDAHTAGLLIRLANSGQIPVGSLQKDESLREKLNAFLSDAVSGDDIKTAQEYIVYLDTIESLIDLAASLVRRR